MAKTETHSRYFIVNKKDAVALPQFPSSYHFSFYDNKDKAVKCLNRLRKEFPEYRFWLLEHSSTVTVMEN